MKESDDDVDNMIGDSAACGVGADPGSSGNEEEQSKESPSYHNRATSCDAVNSSHSKIKQIICNIPNGVTAQANNNLSCAAGGDEVQTMPTCIDCNRVNGSESTLEGRVNGLHLNGNSSSSTVNGADSLLTNNVNCCPTPNCSTSVSDVFSSLHDNLSANCDARLERRSSADRRGARWRDDSSSSDTGNEGEDGLSADECCIYTYKGDQMADLPSSFFRLAGDQAAARAELRENHERHSRGSSPEMDFLEMDFDPGPSCEQDSDQFSDRDSLRDDEMDVFAEIQENNVVERREEGVEDLSRVSESIPLDVPFVPRDLAPERTMLDVASTSSVSFTWQIEDLCFVAGQAQGTSATRKVWAHHGSSGELCPPGETFSPGELLPLDEPHRIGINGSGDISIGWFDGDPLESAMVWTEEEAWTRQVTQIGPSACGATAVINALAALGVQFCPSHASAAVETRSRRNSASLADYLASRSEAGAAHEDLARGVDAGSAGLATTRFFPLFPRPPLPLAAWLAHWIVRGAVPIATLNLQRGVSAGSVIPDAWHHQMVFGAGGGLVRLTNPLEAVREEALWPQLASPAVLRVRRTDVTARWQASADLRPLAAEPRWRALNVLGQVVNVIREHVASTSSQAHVMTQHVVIPARYTSGITLVVVRDSTVHHELLAAPDLVSRR